MIAVHVTAERVARGHIQKVAFRSAYSPPSRHEAAARRRRRRNSFNSRGNFARVWKREPALRSYTRLVLSRAGLEPCAGNDVLLRRIDVLCGELRLVGAIGHASIVNPATVGLRQREWDRANGEK